MFLVPGVAGPDHGSAGEKEGAHFGAEALLLRSHGQ